MSNEGSRDRQVRYFIWEVFFPHWQCLTFPYHSRLVDGWSASPQKQTRKSFVFCHHLLRPAVPCTPEAGVSRRYAGEMFERERYDVAADGHSSNFRRDAAGQTRRVANRRSVRGHSLPE